MIGASKILTVSYGTFSCTLEGFDEPFNTMKAIAEYFRDLAAEDRYFGAEPPTPDAAMLHRIAEREIQRRVEAKIQDNGVILRAADIDAREADLPSTAPAIAAPSVAAVAQHDINGESIAARLSRLRSAQDEFVVPEVVAEPSIQHVSEAAAIAAEAYTEDQHADDISQSILLQVNASTPETQAEARNLNDDFDQINTNFNHTDSALDELIAAEVVADQPFVDLTAIDLNDLNFDDQENDLYEIEDPLPEDATAEFVGADQFADQLPEADADDQDWQAEADNSDNILASINDLIENNDQTTVASQPEGMTPRQQRRLAHHLAALEAAKVAAEQNDLIEETDDDALLASLSTLEIPAAAAPDFGPEDDDLLEETVAQTTPVIEPAPIAAAPEAAQPSESIQRARARVIKIRRADAPVAEPTAAQAAVLSAEAEADLEAELASLRAEAEPVAPTRPARPVRNLAVRAPAAPVQSPVMDDEDVQLSAALASMRLGETDPVATQPAAAPQHAAPQPVENRKRLEAESDDAAVSRLMEATNTAMDGAENRRRHAAISHLKAAVAATEAERQIKAINPGRPVADRQDIYRNDLESVVRPRSVEPRTAEPRATDVHPAETRAEARAASNAERPTPLVLVSEQRIDRPKEAPAAPAPAAAAAPRMVLPSRPRRIAPNASVAAASVASVASLQVNDTLLGTAEDDLDEDDIFDAAEDANYFAPSETFDDFVDKLGATTLPELLEASAVYCAQVLGRPLFSRTMVMHQVQSLIDAPDHNLEDSLRGFGTLLRQGRLAKIKRGHFAVTDRSPMLAEALRIAG
jgi:hypothetical protein